MSLIVVIQNVSDLASTSDYKYEVLVGDGSPRSKTLAKGEIKGHVREHGWQVLVQKLLDQESAQQ